MKHRQSGFTLIELMIVVTIVAILASIAYPSYQQFVRRTARSEAKSALLENAQFLERNFTSANRYNADSAGNAIDASKLPVPRSPRDGTKRYDLDVIVNADTPLEFTLTATPTAGSPMAGDGCGTFTLNQRGAKGLEEATLTEAECWNK